MINKSTGAWSRIISGISGTLVAVEPSTGKVTLQLADLHGDIVGSAADSEAETKLTPASEVTEFGVPRTSTTAKYGWLGATKVTTEVSTGVVNMGARTYIPQLGRFEQQDPDPGGSVNAYAYTFDDPVNQSDPSGAATVGYNYEAAETGAAEAGLPEVCGGPGAVKPPPADLQAEAEFAAVGVDRRWKLTVPEATVLAAFLEGASEDLEVVDLPSPLIELASDRVSRA
jgi:RHS repeat-associated protein